MPLIGLLWLFPVLGAAVGEKCSRSRWSVSWLLYSQSTHLIARVLTIQDHARPVISITGEYVESSPSIHPTWVEDRRNEHGLRRGGSSLQTT